MNKADLIEAVAHDCEMSRSDAATALESVLDNIEKHLKKGNKVTLVGFGTFSVSKRAARTGRNPQTGKPIKIPARKVAKFSPGKRLKDALN